MSESWTENESRVYRKLVRMAVPRREHQIASILTLLPLEREARARIVELGSGTGTLSSALLEAFPSCEVLALDGSSSMRRRAESLLSSRSGRFEVCDFTLASEDWLPRLEGADAVVSSLTLHHLRGEEKKRLFRQIASLLSVRGALLIADLVAPRREEARELFRSTWDASAKHQADRDELWELFRKERWNLYRYPDPGDHPSPLFDQLRWLSESGFPVVDCFWLEAGHAVYGGFLDEERPFEVLPYEEALAISRRAIEETT